MRHHQARMSFMVEAQWGGEDPGCEIVDMATKRGIAERVAESYREKSADNPDFIGCFVREVREGAGLPVALATAMNAVDVPGETPFPFVPELTETEWAVVSALRDARNAEESWEEYNERIAWQMISQLTAGLRQGDTEEQMQGYCDPDEYPLLHAAALANAEAIAFLKAKYAQSQGGK